MADPGMYLQPGNGAPTFEYRLFSHCGEPEFRSVSEGEVAFRRDHIFENRDRHGPVARDLHSVSHRSLEAINTFDSVPSSVKPRALCGWPSPVVQCYFCLDAIHTRSNHAQTAYSSDGFFIPATRIATRSAGGEEAGRPKAGCRYCAAAHRNYRYHSRK